MFILIILYKKYYECNHSYNFDIISRYNINCCCCIYIRKMLRLFYGFFFIHYAAVNNIFVFCIREKTRVYLRHRHACCHFVKGFSTTLV